MPGWGHGPNASEHKETERQPGTTEKPPHYQNPRTFHQTDREKNRDRGEIGEDENQTLGTKAKEMVSVHVSTICKDLSRQLYHRVC
jgi:hypothetical protein